MTNELQQDFFALFGLPRRFRIEEPALEAAYHELHSRVHPDRHAHLPDADRRRAMQWATRVNEAFSTLRDPLARARYLIELAGIDVGLETNTVMSPAFLVEQMEWREAVEEAEQAADAFELEHLHQRLRGQTRELLGELEHQIDGDQAFDEAADTARRLMFLDKLRHEIDDALEALDN